MNDDRLPPNTIATMAHGRVTVQAWWRESSRTESGRALSWGVDGEEVDHNRMREAAAAGDPAAATLIGFWTMATAHHVEAPWFLTSLGKDMAGECPCGPCSWTDPPARKRREATPKKKVTAKEKRNLAYKRQKKVDAAVAAQLEAAERRAREADLGAEEQRKIREERFARLMAETRAERDAAAERERANREARRELGRKLQERFPAATKPRAAGQFAKAGAPAPSAEELHEKRVRAGKASGAARRAKKGSK